MSGFGDYHQRAIKTEWAEHYVNYSALKTKLSSFNKRRDAFKKIHDGGGQISEEDLYMGSLAHGLDTKYVLKGSKPRKNSKEDEVVDDLKYVAYKEGKESGNVGLNTKDDKSVMYRLSQLERSEFCATVEHEVEKAAKFYSTSILPQISLALQENNTLSKKQGQKKEVVEIEMSEIKEKTTEPSDRASAEGEKACEVEKTKITSSSNEEEVEKSIMSKDKMTDSSESKESTENEEEKNSENSNEKVKEEAEPNHEESDIENTSKAEIKTRYEAIGDNILEGYAFLVLNVVTLRQSLLRYDGFVRTNNGLPLSNWYLTKMADSTEDALLGIFHLDALFNLQKTFLSQYSKHLKEEQLSDEYLKHLDSDFEQMKSLLDKTFYSVEKASRGNITRRDRWITSIRHYIFLGMAPRSLAYEPSFLHMKGKHLKREIDILAKWREAKRMPKEEVSAFSELDPDTVYPIILNLISCFLYMMGGYIAEPSSAYYVNALGSNDALAGMIIGCMPWAALFSAIGYSFWTNKSYKQPILFACVMSVIGNYMYASALKYDSIELCLFGRAVTGLGAPRIINRRFIADTTPFSVRTAATAAFGMVTALGAALGPGAAILLDFFDIETELPYYGTFYLNGMTGPGYFMCFTWIIYFFLILFTFEEPTERAGIIELKKREAAKALSEGLLIDEDDESVMSNMTPKKPKSGEVLDKLESSNGNDDKTVSSSTVASSVKTEKSKESSLKFLIKHITPPVYLCMLLVFLKRVVLECVVASTSIVTKNRYGWSTKYVGLLHFINGLLIIPLCMLSGYLSIYFEDRYLTLWCMSFTLLGVFFLIDPTDFMPDSVEVGYNADNPFSVGPARYVIGSLIAFGAVEVNESFMASLLSKVVPSALATGTLNSGLLLTLVGTSGRASGDTFITLMGYLSLRHLLNLVVVPAFFFVLTSIIIVRVNYEVLYEL